MAADGKRARLVVAGGVVAALLLAMIGWFALVHPKLADADNTRSLTSDAELQNITLQRKVSTLKAASENMSALTAQLRAAREALPIDASLDGFTDELAQIAAKTKVTVTDVNAGTPALASDSGSSSSTPSTADTPKSGPAGKVFSIPVTVVSAGKGTAQTDFLHALQYGARAVLVTDTAFAPSAAAGPRAFDLDTTLTTTLQVFVNPQSPAAESALLQQLGQQTG